MVGSAGSGFSYVSLLLAKVRAAADVDEWRKWWATFCTIYTTKYPRAAPQLFAYENKIYSFKASYTCSLVWREYDEEFRRLKAADPLLDWHETHGALDAVLDSLMIHRDFQSSHKESSAQPHKERESKGRKHVKLLSNGTCHHWNHGNCSRDHCKWSHVCNNCKGDHKHFRCKSKPT